jgi:glycosyltransferase involved in cell wall biosynthesis
MASGNITVAAVMAVYNQRATVAEALDSVFTQTRPPEEVIVVDDGSTDGTGDLVAQRYGPKVRLIRQKNQGAATARNTGVRAAGTDLVAFIDGDDRWLPEYLARQAAVMAAHPECMLSFTAAVLHNEALGTTSVEGEHIDKATYLRKTFFQERLLPATDAVIVRRRVFDEVGWFEDGTLIYFDTDMWLRIMARHGFEHLPEPLVWVRRGEHQTTPLDREKTFHWNHRYYRKHRYTFGRGLGAQAAWRAGYGAALREQAIWYFHGRQGWKGFTHLAHAVSVWPFFNPGWVARAWMECLLGDRVYGGLVSAVHRVTGRGRQA